MPKKIKIHLTYTKTCGLMWSSDETSWAEVGPLSPQTIVGKEDEISWIADDTISDIKIQLDNNKIIDQPIFGSDKAKNGKVKNNPGTGDRTKYSILVTPLGLKPITVDPEIKEGSPPG